MHAGSTQECDLKQQNNENSSGASMSHKISFGGLMFRLSVGETFSFGQAQETGALITLAVQVNFPMLQPAASSFPTAPFLRVSRAESFFAAGTDTFSADLSAELGLRDLRR